MKDQRIRYMPKYILLLFLALPSQFFAQNSGKINFYMDICRFREITRAGNLVELYFSIDGNSIVNKKGPDGNFHANVDLSYFLQKVNGRDSIPVGGDNVNMDWPDGRWPEDTSQSTLANSLYLTLPKRLKPGEYVLRGFAEDKNSSKRSYQMSTYSFEVPEYPSLGFSFSDIKWISARTSGRGSGSDRGGIPLINNDIFVNPDSLVFFQQLYNMNTLVGNNKFFIRCRLMRDDQYLMGYRAEIQSRTPFPFSIPGQTRKGSSNAFLNQLNIRSLKTGYYYLQVEVLENEDDKIPIQRYRKKFFVHNSRIDLELGAFSRETDIFNEYDEEELDYFLSTLVHTANSQEKNFIKVLNDYEQKKNYLYSFFEKRRKADQSVLALWEKHLLTLKYVNSKYPSKSREGWETDRGRITLKYGIPSDIEVRTDERNLLPHEIWKYDRLGVQTNVIFVFYESDLTSGEYFLLHSSKYGEKSNAQWRSLLNIQNATGIRN
ncbi:MAG: GWxTD domain-containing protein [Bacteroidia bacterium]|nr:GWxTD domain-containing protein [Bacteroidia bacterium]